MIFSVNQEANSNLINYIKNSIVPLICEFDEEYNMYTLNFSKAKINKKYSKVYNRNIKYLKNIKVKGLTKKIKETFYKNNSCPEGNKKYRSSNNRIGKRIHNEIFNYIKNNKLSVLSPFSEAILKHLDTYNEMPIISELPVLSNKKRYFHYCSQLDMITHNKKTKKTIGYEIKTFYPSKRSVSGFKTKLYHKKEHRSLNIRDSKLNRAYLQLAYTKEAFEETYNTKLDNYYVLCVYENYRTKEIIVERVEYPNWFKKYDNIKLLKKLN